MSRNQREGRYGGKGGAGYRVSLYGDGKGRRVIRPRHYRYRAPAQGAAGL